MRLLISVVLVSAFFGCGPGKSASPEPAAPSAGSEPVDAAAKPATSRTLAEVGLDPTAFDRSADPCDDFYQFACGGWVAKTEIAADKPMAMRSFIDIEDRNQEYLHSVLDKAAADPGSDAALQKVGAYYAACMDEAAVEKAGIRPIAPFLASIRKVSDAKSLSAVMAELSASGVNVLFAFGPTQDSADAKQVIGNIDQGGLGLPDRDYYLKQEPQNAAIVAAYKSYVSSVLELAGRKPDAAAREAGDILALETEIAKVSKDKVARRDPRGMYNKIDRAGVAGAMSHFDWDRFWKALGLADITGITVTSPEFLAGVDKLLVSTKPATWRAYLTFHVLNRNAPLLTKKVQDAQFRFEQALTGQPEMEARWKRCVQFTDAGLGHLLGQIFVRDRFAGESKRAAEEQVRAISQAMRQNLASLSWMDAKTKARANEKLDKVFYQIGYPNKWLTYDFPVDRKTFGANALAARRAERARQLAKIGKPVDKDDWLITPPTVNAYYEPQLNGMVFPAGILQPPFYDVRSSIQVNLGAMGMVVGHELTHGFDDQGSQYDADGNLTNWWEESTNREFKARTQCVSDQYGRYEQAGMKLNGPNTLGENIADIGGLKLAFAGYHALRARAPERVVADGFSEDQQFFIGFAQSWCAKARPDFEKLLVNVDVHSPPRWRVNGTLQATPAFGKAFRCKPRAKMVPEKMCEVW
jgi:putative endopeptidase